MRDIFLSYKSDDVDRARPLVEALETAGWSLWWDRRLAAGESYAEKIQTELEASRCVVVLWSRTSVRSRWVRAEAQDAADRHLLFPVFLDRVRPPLEFRSLNGVDLTAWGGSLADAEFKRLLESLESRLGGPAEPHGSGEAAETVAPAAGPPRGRAPQPTGVRNGRTGTATRGESTALRALARELAQTLERIARAGRRAAAQASGDSATRRAGETAARAVSLRLRRALEQFAASRAGPVSGPDRRAAQAAILLRYLTWSFALPCALLLLSYALRLLLA